METAKYTWYKVNFNPDAVRYSRTWGANLFQFNEFFPEKWQKTASTVWKREAFSHLRNLQVNLWEYVFEVMRLNQTFDRPADMVGKNFYSAPKEMENEDWYVLNHHQQTILVSEHNLVRSLIPEGIELPYFFWKELKDSADWDVIPNVLGKMPACHIQTYLDSPDDHGSGFVEELEMIHEYGGEEFGQIPYMWFKELYS